MAMTTIDRETAEAIESLTNPTQTETIVQIPVDFYAHYENGVITKFVVSPQESYAGYFGPGSQVWDGPDVDLEGSDIGNSPFWTAVSAALAAAPDGITVEWQE